MSSSVYYHFHFFFYIVIMRKVLAVASVASEHRELVFKEIKKIFKRLKISLDILLQEETMKSQFPPENGNVFKSYPYITLTIPNYEQHRECTYFTIQISKKYTKITSFSTNSYYLSPKEKTMTNLFSTKIKTYLENTAEIGTHPSHAPSTALLSSPISKNKSTKLIEF